MKQKKWVLFVVLLALFSPLSVSGEEQQQEDNVGIGFKDEQPADPDDPKVPADPEPIPVPKDPTPINNVLPLTSGSGKDYPSARSGALPKTGEVRHAGMQWMGLLCISSSFWLFLFTRLREEEDDEQESRFENR